MSSVNSITLPSPADFHVHVRQGAMCELVAPHVSQGGVKTAYVMPNLVPPVTSAERAMEYQAELKQLAPETEWLMTLYLCPDVTVDEIRKAKKAGVRGVKSYPRGVTTNSSSGIEDYSIYYPVFKAMEEEGLVLNLHGEVPSDHAKNISILNAEKHFLSHLRKLAADFPNLKIVLEHATTAEAIECVKSLPDNVACSITAHHLYLTIDTVAPQPHHFCKPLAKEPKDRDALQSVIAAGHPRFFLGSDSAPHPTSSKSPTALIDAPPSPCAAGVYTSPILIPLVAHLLEGFGALEKLQDFVSGNGRAFYGIPPNEGETVTIKRAENKVKGLYSAGEIEVVPFWAGQTLGWEIAKDQ